MTELADKAFADAYPIDKLAARWGCCEKTILNIEANDDTLKHVKLPGTAKRHYLTSDIAMFESRMKNPPSEPLTQESMLLQTVEDLQARLAAAESKLATPTVDAARRRRQTFEVFDKLVDADDRFRSVIERKLVEKLNADSRFDADDVELFVAGEREQIRAVASLLVEQRHAAAMDAVAGPTRRERQEQDAERAKAVKRAKIGGAGVADDATDEEGYALDIRDDDPCADLRVEPFEFGKGQ